MQIVSEEFKTAISKPSREIKSRITLPELTLDDDNIQIINLDSSLVFGEDFEIGTTPMATVKIELIFSPERYIEYDYEDKECDAQIGIKLPDDTVEYLSIGLFTVEEVIKNDYKITLNCVDRMYKAEKEFVNNLMFPTTILDILQSACEQSNITLATTNFANANYVIPNEPVFDNITCRTIFAQVAELAGGYAVINRQGELEILTLGNIPVRNITKDHYIDFKRDEVGIGKIDRVIVKVGEETSEQGIGDNIYTIVDNMFVQDPNDVVGPLFNVLKDVSYNACKLKWQGDFSLDLGDKITINGHESYVLDRKLRYTGGLREDYRAPAKSNVERNSTGKSNILLDINNVKTQIKVIEGEVTQTIESIEGEVRNEVAEQMKTAEIYTWIRYADDEYGNGISDTPAGKKYVGIATNKKNVEPSNTPDDYEWSLIKGDKGAQGEPGKDGIPGEPGKDGESQYTYIRYSINSNGNPMTTTPTGATKYIGLAVTTSSTAPSGYASYTWQKFVGDDGSDGAQGQQGIPGTPGEDGTTYYTWIKYATTPTTDMSDNPAGKDYIGIAHNKTTATESTSYNDYTWSLIKGEDGEDGQTTYTWIMYANDVLGNGISDTPEDKRYVGIATNKLTPNKSVNPNDYEWSPLYDNVEIGGTNRLYDSRTNIEFSHGEWGRNLLRNASALNGDPFVRYNLGYNLVNSPTYINGTRTAHIVNNEGLNDGSQMNSGIRIHPTNLIPGEVYTFYFYGNDNWEKFHPISYYFQDASSNNPQSVVINSDWTRYSVEFTPQSSNIWIYIRPNRNLEYDFDVYLNAPKIEKGSQATPWTPAPEDVEGWLDIKLIRGPGNPYYKVVSPHADFTSLSVGFPNSRFAEPLESLGRVTISLDVMVEVDREITINNSTFAVPGNRWTRIFFTKEFTENNNTSTRVLTPYSRKRKVIRNISTNLIDELRTDINTLYYRNLQVEQGNVPTSYNLTPEELEGEITRSKTEIKQLKDSILLVATRNENTGRFEITPESIVQAIDTTDGVGRLKTVKVTVDENGLTVDDGALIIRDRNNTAIVTSDGLRVMYIFTSSGEFSGWQQVGILNRYTDLTRRMATINIYIPADLIIDKAELHTKSMPSYWTGHTGVPNGFYHARNLKLYEGDASDGVLDWPYSSSYDVTFGRSGRTDITSNTWGGNWTPTGEGIKTKTADVKDYIYPGQSTVFIVDTADSVSEANSRYMGAMQMDLIITGFLRG